MTAESTHVQVRLRGVPLSLRARAAEYDQDLLRELALVRLAADVDSGSGSGSGISAPSRLLALADEVRSSYGGMAAGPNAEMEAAMDRGEEFVDVVYAVPAEVSSFLHRAEEVLEEVDRFCREGRYLLTLAVPDDIAAYRRWIFGEFHRQIAGEPPVPWSESPEARQGATDV